MTSDWLIFCRNKIAKTENQFLFIFTHCSKAVVNSRENIGRIQPLMRKFIALRLFHQELDTVYKKFLIQSIKCSFTKLGTIWPSIESIRSSREVGVLLRCFPQCCTVNATGETLVLNEYLFTVTGVKKMKCFFVSHEVPFPATSDRRSQVAGNGTK